MDGTAIDRSDDAIAAAVASAEITPLVVAVACLTGDTGLLDRCKAPDPAALFLPDGGLTAEDLERNRAEVTDALVRHRDRGRRASPPERATVVRFLRWMTSDSVSGDAEAMYLEELDLGGDDLRRPTWNLAAADPDRELRVAVIGAGMSGLLAGHRLGQAGIDHVIFEKNDDVGGTWLENSYPGCRVDVPTFFYSYSFDQRTDWPETYSRQDVLLDYFRSSADRFGLRDRIRFGTTVTSMVWDDDACTWQVTVDDGRGPETLTFDAVVSAVGQLNRPKLPDIPGLDRFAGPCFHSARWDHDVELAGRRVGVIGTGCTGAQLIPEVAEDADHLTVFQRTPNWLVPADSLAEPIGDDERWLLDVVPTFGRWWRLFQFFRFADGLLPAAVVDPDWTGADGTVSQLNAFVRSVFVAHLEGTFTDPELRRRSTPTYPPIARRVVRDDGIWARTLERPNTTLVTDGIAEVTPQGVVTEDGTHHDLDVLVLATGFTASEFLMPMRVTGSGGVDLHDRWSGDARAHLGITIPGFPNLFCLYGPNTNIVINGSIIFFSEAEVRYVLEALRLLVERGAAALECTPEAHDRHNADVDAGNRRMAWGASEVRSWYKNASGRVTQNWPHSLLEYWKRTRYVDVDDFRWRMRQRGS